MDFKKSGNLEIRAAPELHSEHIPQEPQKEETPDCPLLKPIQKIGQERQFLDKSQRMFNPLAETPLDMTPSPTLDNIHSDVGFDAYMHIVNGSCKTLHDEPTSRDPMVESSSTSGSSSDTNEPVCAQLLTQLNTAYQHLAPDAQALFCDQENGGKPPMVGIQLVVPKPPKNYSFTSWNWPVIRRVGFWSIISTLIGCAALVIGLVITMPRQCDPPVEWWQGSLFYEIFPGSYQDSIKDDGIGDIPGILARLDYLKDLGVRGIRLNSIFRSVDYPERYADVKSLTEIDPHLGTLQDLEALVAGIHDRNMALILDLPLYPFVRNLQESDQPSAKVNSSDVLLDRHKRSDVQEATLADVVSTALPSSVDDELKKTTACCPLPEPIPITENPVIVENVVSKAIRFWSGKHVDGFYLKGLQHYLRDDNFIDSLKSWKYLVGEKRILMCDYETLAMASSVLARDAILKRIDLLDVILNVANGTQSIRDQIEDVTNGVLYEAPFNPRYPWVQWSTGSINTVRVASSLQVNNASVAAALMVMMLPGTPSIFYGDEVGLQNCDCSERKNLESVNNLVPMTWNDKANSNGIRTSSALPWIPKSAEAIKTNLDGAISRMTKLRRETPSIYVNTKLVYSKSIVKYASDEMIIIERGLRRRNSYVFIANLGAEAKTKDLSSIYYGGDVVVGPENKVNKVIYFKELSILPGEALVIKLDK